MHQIYTLSHADALYIIQVIQKELENSRRAAAIAVADSHGELLAFLRMDGCPLPPINNAINKAFTAARERRESAAVGKSSREEGFPMTNFGDLRYTAWGGGVPIVYKDQVVGAVGVSGLPETDDVVLAQMGVNALSVTFKES